MLFSGSSERGRRHRAPGEIPESVSTCSSDEASKDLVVLETEPDLQVIRDLPEFKLMMKGAAAIPPSPGG